MPKIVRLTLMKVTDAETIQQAIQKYSTLTQDAKKVRACLTPHFIFYPVHISSRCKSPFGPSACYLHVTRLATTRLSTPISLGHGVNATLTRGVATDNFQVDRLRVCVVVRLQACRSRTFSSHGMELPANGKQ
jgi:hypothetical protein